MRTHPAKLVFATVDLDTYDGYFSPEVGLDVAVLDGIGAILLDDLEETWRRQDCGSHLGPTYF
jgi:hypothetical protein